MTSRSSASSNPTARVELVEGAGHSIQGDKPLELARLLVDFLEE